PPSVQRGSQISRKTPTANAAVSVTGWCPNPGGRPVTSDQAPRARIPIANVSPTAQPASQQARKHATMYRPKRLTFNSAINPISVVSHAIRVCGMQLAGQPHLITQNG